MQTRPFDAAEWRANPALKVVTRSGDPVRVICVDAPGAQPIVALDEGGEPWRYCSDGGFFISNEESGNDLRFNDPRVFTDADVEQFVRTAIPDGIEYGIAVDERVRSVINTLSRYALQQIELAKGGR